jgi:hypothetical protein
MQVNDKEDVDGRATPGHDDGGRLAMTIGMGPMRSGPPHDDGDGLAMTVGGGHDDGDRVWV